MSTKHLERESNVLKHIAEASKAIRHKHKMLKLGKDTAERAMTEIFKPVLTPLEKVVANTEIARKSKKITNGKKTGLRRKYLSVLSSKKRDSDDSSSDASFGSAIESNEKQLSMITSTPSKPSSSSSSHNYLTFKKDLSMVEDGGDFVNREKSIEPLNESPSPQPLKRTKFPSTSHINTEQLIHTYLRKFGTSQEKSLDTVRGVRNLRDGLKIGNAKVSFDGNSMRLQWKSEEGEEEKMYQLTPGLITLILDKSPNMEHVTEADKQNYRKVILDTNAHLKYYREGAAIRTSTDPKFTNIISSLLASSKTGTALLPKYMIAPSKRRKVDYVWWDDPNELVERLRLLMASQAAGNTSHTNEIFSIIEELREAGIVY